MASKLRSRYSYILGFLGLLFISCAIFIVWNQTYILDKITIFQNPPSMAVSKLAERSYMNNYGSFVFFASRPEIEETQRFNDFCGDHEIGSAVLGCFVNSRIYLYSVKKQELDGINEVTAAHEMLHAAYQRLGDSDKKKVNELLNQEIKNQKENKIFTERMETYDKLSEADKLNEYHSVIGTEVEDISQNLEKYYATFFNDRSKIVEMHQSYSDIFLKLQEDSKKIATDLGRRAKAINSRVTDYNKRSSIYIDKVENFNARAEAGSIGQMQFNTERQNLVLEQSRLNQLRNDINRDIKLYENDRKKLDSLALHLTDLNQSIDSSVAPLPGVQ